MRKLTILVLVLLALVFAGGGSAASLPDDSNSNNLLHNPTTAGVQTVTSSLSFPVPMAVKTEEPGKTCMLIDFEGIGNNSPVPEFDGITSPGWLGLIDADAGGTGNFAFEPSPNTIAYWLGGDPGSRDILFAEPVSEVSFFYASAVDVQLEAFDADDNSVATATGPANYNQGPGGDPNGSYNKWDPLGVETNTNIITKVRVTGNVNQTGIDNLEVCLKIGIHSVEFTQAIQEWQSLDDLQSDLQGDGQPPVPIIAQKPLALRVYMEEVDTVTEVRVQLSGVASAERTIQLQPNCTPEQSRQQANGCQSVDFYFTPPAGEWTATIKTFDQNDDEIESHDFTLTSVQTNPLTLRAVSVCDMQNPDNSWECADENTLGGLTGFLERTAPTHDVQVLFPGHVVRRNTNDYTANPIQWWIDIAQDIHNLGTNPYYYGMVRPNVPTSVGGIANGIPSRGAASRTSVVRLGEETNDQVVAHETGHMLGRRHTNTGDPTATGGTPPGCYSTAQDSSTDWPYSNNRIQSGPAANPELEVGFDVANRQAIDPENHYDWMGYCAPRWISPHTYRNALTTLQTTTSDLGLSSALIQGKFWRVSGVIEGGYATLDPLFEFETIASIEPGTGSYRIEILDDASSILYTRYFTPTIALTESEDPADDVEIPIFSELIPVQTGASQILLFDPDNTEIGNIALTGAAPVVNITHPLGGGTLYGIQTISWQIYDNDSIDLVSWVQYSADGGSSWHILAASLNNTELAVDFDEMPGADGNALIRILASDGANTGTDTSNPFTVSKKQPTALIIFPEDGSVFRSGDLVWLKGQGIDLEDSPLPDVNMVWESDIDGVLGNGNHLPIETLSEGEHTITFTVEDSDDNVASNAITIFVDGTMPVLNLTITPDGTPASCVGVNIDAFDPIGSSGLETGQYSFNGGGTWTSIELSTLPLTFTVPGEGFIHLLVRVADHAENLAAADAKFFIETPCPNAAPVANAGENYTGEEGEAIVLDGSQSSDPDGTIILYEWDFDNDGEYDDATGMTQSVTFADNGTYTVSVRITDNHNATAVDSAIVTTTNVSPTVEAGTNITATVEGFVNLAKVTFTDPGSADSHTASVDWGDGTIDEAIVYDSTIYAYHSYASEDDYTTEICITDDDGGVGCDTFTVTVESIEYLVFLPVTTR